MSDTTPAVILDDKFRQDVQDMIDRYGYADVIYAVWDSLLMYIRQASTVGKGRSLLRTMDLLHEAYAFMALESTPSTSAEILGKEEPDGD